MSIEEGTSGYPEDQPSEVAGDQPPGGPREGADIPDGDRAPDNDDGTATGSREAAGASE